MNRRNRILVLALTLAASCAAFSESKGSAESSNRWGLLFDCKNVLALEGYEDGFQAGAGAKYWITPSIAARALARIDHNTPPEDSVAPASTELGLGAAGEWHPAKRAAASPYLGGLAGFQIYAEEGADSTLIDLYLGGLFGVEVKLFNTVSCFAEYQLLAAWDIKGFTLSLGTEGSDSSRALIGLIFYF
jgi:hypothetical protein